MDGGLKVHFIIDEWGEMMVDDGGCPPRLSNCNIWPNYKVQEEGKLKYTSLEIVKWWEWSKEGEGLMRKLVTTYYVQRGHPREECLWFCHNMLKVCRRKAQKALHSYHVPAINQYNVIGNSDHAQTHTSIQVQ